MNLTCDKCKEKFYFDKIKTRQHENGIEEVYFTCPHCHAEFTSYYTNAEVKVMQVEVQSLTKAIQEAKNRKEKRKLIRELESLQKKMKKTMDRLRKEVEDKEKGTLSAK